MGPAASYFGMRNRVHQEVKTALLIALAMGVVCFGAAIVTAKLVGYS